MHSIRTVNFWLCMGKAERVLDLGRNPELLLSIASSFGLLSLVKHHSQMHPSYQSPELSYRRTPESNRT